ncbi:MULTISPECIES: type II restriction endonuclease [Paracoccus]|uniref:type II restriction endonuclease n=1 Tax=Paracoccus TaxID=265 RepID=UPI001F053ED9|nr:MULTISPECIES: type II restriction endonuclease [Paracoccus]
MKGRVDVAGKGYLSGYFVGAGAKVLRGTEVDPAVSRGHEFQGVDVFRAFVGTPAERERIPVTYIWMDDEQEAPLRLELTGTWYNSRKAQLHRAPEYRLYYPAAAESVVHRAQAGDTLFLCMTSERKVLAILCPSGSSAEQKLLWLFGLQLTDDYALSQRDIGEDGGRGIDLAAKFILDELGIEAEEPEPDALDQLVGRFGAAFPGTAAFSAFARKSVKGVDPLADPDAALVAWMEHEEALFRHLERIIVAERLKEGFLDGEQADVDGFLSFSLSVQNRRKSRAGYAFAHHVEALLTKWNVRYKREATTEKRNAADFLFPGEAEYADPTFPTDKLRMLAVKTTCKDRWRQVLAEAERITAKHLLTLEPSISRAQTGEMQAQALQLVLPQSIHATYHTDQQNWLMSVRGFLDLVRAA